MLRTSVADPYVFEPPESESGSGYFKKTLMSHSIFRVLEKFRVIKHHSQIRADPGQLSRATEKKLPRFEVKDLRKERVYDTYCRGLLQYHDIITAQVYM
jgi:hypothetical protein